MVLDILESACDMWHFNISPAILVRFHIIQGAQRNKMNIRTAYIDVVQVLYSPPPPTHTHYTPTPPHPHTPTPPHPHTPTEEVYTQINYMLPSLDAKA